MGEAPAMQGCVFSDVLDMSFYTSCPGFGASSPLRLPHDQPSLDLSVTLFRCVRLVGGGWTERIKVDPQLMSVARHLYERNILASPRTCPLCRALPGTPRHVIMSCSVMKPLVDLLRDALVPTVLCSAVHTCGTGMCRRVVWERSLAALPRRCRPAGPCSQPGAGLFPRWTGKSFFLPTLGAIVRQRYVLRGNVTSPTAVFHLLHLVVPSSSQLGARLCRMTPCLTQLKALRTF